MASVSLQTLTGKRHLVSPHIPDLGGVSSVFTVAFHDLHLEMLRKCRETIRERFG